MGQIEMQDGHLIRWTYLSLQIELVSDEGPVTRFVPLWKNEDHQGTIKGMSGGPAFIHYKGNLYWCGVQSSEIIAGNRVKEITVSPSLLIMPLLSAFAEKVNEIASSRGVTLDQLIIENE